MYEAVDDHNVNQCPSELINQVLSRLESDIAPHDHKRIEDLIFEFLDSTKSAFWIQLLNPLTNVLEILTTKYVKSQLYKKPLKKLLKKCAVPPKLLKPSDILEYASGLQEYFSVLGSLLSYLEQKNCNSLQCLIAHAIRCIFEPNSSNPINCVTPEACLKAIEKSSLPEILGHLLAIVKEDVFIDLLHICTALSEKSEICCTILLKQDVINSVMMRLEPNWESRYPHTKPPLPSPLITVQHYEEIINFLWILLKFLDGNRDLVKELQVPRQFGLWSLLYAFRSFTFFWSTKVDRNNVLGIILFLIKIFPNLEFVQSGLQYDVVILNLACDLKTCQYYNTNIVLQNTTLDFNFRKLLLLCLVYYKSFSALRVICDEKMIRCLLMIISNKQKVNWYPSYHTELVAIALDILCNLISLNDEDLIGEFIENSGPQIITETLEACSKDLYPDNVLIALCNVINSVHLLPSIDILQDPRNSQIVYSLLLKTLNKPALKEQEQTILSLTFHLLTLFAPKITDFKEIFKTCLQFFQRSITPNPQDIIQNPKVMICAIQLVRVVVLKTDDVSTLIKGNLIYYLLDILVDTIFPVKIILLRLLVELCESCTCIPYLLTWRKKKKKFVPLLMDIFREEGALIGTKIGPNGEIDDLEYPIMGCQQQLEMKCVCAEYQSGKHPVISDMLLSCRPNIYALLQSIYNHFGDTTEITNDTYKLYNEELSVKDQITMIVADNYLDLKISEAWKELENDFKSHQVKYYFSDKFLVSILNERNKKWALKLQIAQKECLRRHKENEMKNEYNFYQELKDTNLQPALQAIKELKYQALCTEKLFQVSKKIQQMNMVQESSCFLGTPHTTFNTDSRYTVQLGLSVSVNKPDIKHEIEAPKPVSPINSEDEKIDFPLCEDPLYKDDEEIV